MVCVAAALDDADALALLAADALALEVEALALADVELDPPEQPASPATARAAIADPAPAFTNCLLLKPS